MKEESGALSGTSVYHCAHKFNNNKLRWSFEGPLHRRPEPASGKLDTGHISSFNVKCDFADVLSDQSFL